MGSGTGDGLSILRQGRPFQGASGETLRVPSSILSSSAHFYGRRGVSGALGVVWSSAVGLVIKFLPQAGGCRGEKEIYFSEAWRIHDQF